MANVVVLNAQDHKTLRCRNELSFEHVAEANLIPLNISEFRHAATSLAIVFVKDNSAGNYRCAALTGLGEKENLMFTAEAINSLYIPAAVQRYPFFIIGDEEKQKVSLCADMDSTLFGEEGEALFTEEGQATDFAKNKLDLLSSFARAEAQTQHFAQSMFEQGLLTPFNLEATIKGEKHSFGGLHKIDEKVLDELDAEQLHTLKQSGALSLIYAHLISLGQIQRLIEIKAK